MKKHLVLAAALALPMLVGAPMATASAQSSAATAATKLTFGTGGLGSLSLTAGSVVDGSATFTVTFPVQDAVGPVAFMVGKDVVGTATVTNGVATATLKLNGFAAADVQALFCGDDHYYPASTLQSAATARFGVDGQAPITLTSTPTPNYEKMFATYTATLPDKGANGTVVFVLDNVIVGSGQVANGTVTIPRGIGTMNVVYAGDSAHAPSSL
jgi:hypothetical protein